MAKKNSRPNLAARKSAIKKAEDMKIARQKQYWKDNQKKILTIAAIAVVAIVVLCLAIDYLYVPANTVRSFMGNVVDASANALIREMDGRYYNMGTVNTPEGYEPADYGMDMTTDKNETFFYFETTDESKAVDSVYLIGVKDRTAEDMIKSVSAIFNYEVQGENKHATIGGQDVHYYYGVSMVNEETPDINFATLTCYIDSVNDSCILVSLSTTEGPSDTMPTEEAMLAEAEAIFTNFSINK